MSYSFGILIAISLSCQGAAGQDVLYGMNDVGHIPGGPDQIVQVDPASGVAVLVHTFPAGLNDLESLTYDARENVLWATNGGMLLRVDARTFAVTTLGPTGFTDIDGLAVQPGTAALFGVTYGGNDLIRLDKVKGTGTLVNGSVEEGSRLEDIAFDTAGSMYVLTSNSLVELLPSDGRRRSKVRLFGASSLEALVWWPAGNTFLSAADRGNFKDLVRLGRDGAVRFVSETQHSGYKDIEALALLPGNHVTPIEMQTLAAYRDRQGAHLAWQARREAAAFVVQRGLQDEGPWQTVGRVDEPVSSRGDNWIYEHVDADAARPPLAGLDLVYRVGVAEQDGTWAWIQFSIGAAPPASAAELHANAPNPFNPTTTFEVRLAVPGRVEVRLFDAAGRVVRDLQSPLLGPGTHAVVWDGRGADGRSVAAGVYPYVLMAGDAVLRGRAVLVK